MSADLSGFYWGIRSRGTCAKVELIDQLEAGGDTGQKQKGWTEGESFPPSIEDEISYVESGSQL